MRQRVCRHARCSMPAPCSRSPPPWCPDCTTSSPSRGAPGCNRCARRSARARASDSLRCASARPRGIRQLPAGAQHRGNGARAAASERMRAGYVPLAQVSGLGVGVLEGLPQLQCLCLDDIDQVAGQPDWERGIFGLLRELEDAGGRLIASAQAPPLLANWALADLGSRCAAGAVFQLRVLDENEQQAALQLRARLRGFELPAETSRWLQRRLPRDMRSLYELLDTLDEAALAAQRRLTIPFIREVLRSAARSRGA